MKITTILLHHSGISYEKNPNQFEANNRVHKKWGVKSSLGYWLGYNYEISMDGIVRQARREGERTVACWQQGMNTGKAIHICLDGNFSIQAPTLQQEKSLTKLLKELKLKYPDTEILHHKNFANTQCPGNLIPANWHKNNTMKLIREKGRRETFAVINEKNYYIRNTDTFEDLQTDGYVNWKNVKELDYKIRIDGVIAG